MSYESGVSVGVDTCILQSRSQRSFHGFWGDFCITEGEGHVDWQVMQPMQPATYPETWSGILSVGESRPQG
jgi:hypothetical protein